MEKMWELTGGGTLTMEDGNGRAVFTVRRKQDGLGLYKVWLRGQGGGTCLLGTLVPEGTMLRLSRSLSPRELERKRCWPVTGGETVLAFRFGGGDGWYREQHPEGLVRDGELAKILTAPMLCNKEKENFHLAAAFHTDAPLQAEPIVTLGRLSRIHGRPYLIWDFNGNGELKIKNPGEGSSESTEKECEQTANF